MDAMLAARATRTCEIMRGCRLLALIIIPKNLAGFLDEFVSGCDEGQ